MYIDIIEKSEIGPYMEEHDFDKLLIKEVKELIKAYDINYDHEEIIPSDDTLANDLWRAGYELILRVGGYNMSTRRRLVFTEEEIKHVLRNLPDKIIIGQGQFQKIMIHRNIEGYEEPIFENGPSGTLVSEDIYFETMIAMAQEDYIDAIGSGSLTTIRGREIKVGSPLEVEAAIFIALTTRKALKMVNKDGLHINDVAVTTPWAKIAAVSNDWGIRKSDSMLVAQMVELKVTNEHIALAKYMLNHGIIVANLMTPIWGGYGGASPGTAIISVAEHILGVLAYGALKHYLSLTHMLNCNNTGRETLWVISTVGQAIARNSKMIALHDCYCAAGPGTKMLLYEVSAGAITACVSGLHGTGIGSAGGKYPDHATGIEGRLYGEVIKSCVAKLKRKDANDIVKLILKKYEAKLNEVKGVIPGKSFRELYDLRTIKPSREWVNIYNEVRKELANLGLPLRI
mgnify:CR=1 FL=1